MLIWSLSSDIYRFKVFLKDSSMDKISFHNQEIKHVTYSSRLEKVISYDSSFKAVIWDINTLQSCQVIMFNSFVQRIFSFEKEPKMLALGVESFLLEKVGLTEFLGEFLLWEVVYDPSIKRFIAITNHDVRVLDFLDGSLQKLYVHKKKDLLQNPDFFEAVQTRHSQNLFLAMDANQQFCLYNFKTMEKMKEVHSLEDHKKESPSAFFFIKEMELLAVGYFDSKIKGQFDIVKIVTSSYI